ncbi:hypothetical protein JXB28_03070 [Candidatus Woesearchaeota archaeon]|nr:hypothetical protein [Candidatus Woesearchaeota archaeon]
MTKYTWIISMVMMGIAALGISLMLGKFGGPFRVIAIFFFALAIVIYIYPSARQ